MRWTHSKNNKVSVYWLNNTKTLKNNYLIILARYFFIQNCQVCYFFIETVKFATFIQNSLMFKLRRIRRICVLIRRIRVLGYF